MAQSELRLLKRVAIHWPREDLRRIPDNTRGLYFLYEQTEAFMNVVYVGIARGLKTGIKSRLIKHRSKDWTHFSAYEVWDNITQKEIEEMEALFLTAYAKDQHANKLNVQRGNRRLRKVRVMEGEIWS